MKTIIPVQTLGLLILLTSLGGASGQTVLWSENFDDGNGNNRWYADTGVWQIGSPTIGPETNSAGYQTHSGSYCATTGLTENYPSDMNSRLVRIQTFAVPAANQFPRLRFWQWYSFGAYGFAGVTYPDYGVVEIRTGTTGTWQAISPQYTDFSGDWSYASVDLSAFAGQTVDVAFHAVCRGGSTAPGWFIDDISLIAGIPSLNNPESFENGIGDWYSEDGAWQVGFPEKANGAPTNSFGAQTHTGTNCALTLLNANYPDGMNSRLISPPFIVPPGSLSPYLRFWHWYSLGAYGFAGVTYPDYGVVEIRVGTNNWQAISPQYTGNSQNWGEPFVDLTSFGGQTVQLAFHAVNRGGSTGAGWYIDDVQVYPYAYPAFPPYLMISPAGTNTVVSWTDLPNYAGFDLEFNPDLTTTNWDPVSTVDEIIGGQNVVTNPVTGIEGFYRLGGQF